MTEHLSVINTNDGTATLYSREYDEHYHSLSGAYEEAFYKFVRPSGLLESCKQRPISIIDVCFGLGYNSLTALEHCDQGYHIEIDAIEKDPCVIQKAIPLSYPYQSWNQCLKELYETGECRYKKGLIRLHHGDARWVTGNLDSHFEIIFLDPFSTQKNTELWTLDFFRLLKAKLSPEGVLVTYSSALPVRSGLLRAGFNIYESEPVGRRRGGTIASLTVLDTCSELAKPDVNSLSEKELFLLTHSDGSIPYRDRKLDSPPQEILARRKKLVTYLLRINKVYKVKQCYRRWKGKV